jgi:hypothetical protein
MEKTQVTFKIAGKPNSQLFSNAATADAFIKSATAKFGSKFEVTAAPVPVVENQPVTSGMSDIDGGAPNFHAAGGKDPKMNNEGYNEEAKGHPDFCECEGCTHNALMDKEFPKEASNMNLSPGGVPSQVLQQFQPELLHELTAYPNATNTPMVNPDISGDPHSTPQYEEGMLPGAIEDVFSTMSRISYVSTSPAGGMGIGRDGKQQILEGAPLRKEMDPMGPGFTEEFYSQTQAIPGASLSIAASLVANKKAGADEKTQFSLFLKRVMGEVAASFIAAFKVTTRMPMNKIPGVGEIQLAQVEQPTGLSAFNVVNTGSRVKYLMEKLTDSEIQDCINDSYAQAAVWHEAKDGGYVYEVFVRAETVDTDSMLLKYKFVTGTKDADE